MKANSTYLKHGCKTRISLSNADSSTWSIDGLGFLDNIGDDVFFTAPNVDVAGSTIVKCLDLDGDEHEIKIFYGTHLHVIANIIQKELGLQDDQVHIEWEKFKIPSDKRIYVTLRSGGGVPFGNVTHGEDNVMQSVNILDPVSIDLFSLDQSSIIQTVKLIMAMKSRYAESQMEVNSMKISSLPTTFNNVSAVEGSVGLKRFNATFNIFYNRIISKSEEYFDKFQTEFIEEP